MNHELYMRRCLELALKGLGSVSPNPLVGCVIVHNGNIIGEGYHRVYGQAHAEVNAVASVKDTSLLSKSTVYVNLEPCNYTGNTPPCADLLLRHQVKQVVVCNQDPNPKIDGGGIDKLRESGVDVVTGVLESEGEQLNRRFFTYHREKRPYVILKWAESLDGNLDIKRQNNEEGVHWITTPSAQIHTHRWRTEETAILVGANTVNIDNPSLTARAVHGNQPLRCVLNVKSVLNPKATVLTDGLPTVIFNPHVSKEDGKVKWVQIDPQNILIDVLQFLYKEKVLSLIVEGGMKTLNGFLGDQLWDEARILQGPHFFGQPGYKVTCPSGRLVKSYCVEENQIKIIQRV